jgi:hypothetical protein
MLLAFVENYNKQLEASLDTPIPDITRTTFFSVLVPITLFFGAEDDMSFILS